MIKMVNIRLEEKLWQQIKVQAIQDGKTLQDYVTEILNKAVKN